MSVRFKASSGSTSQSQKSKGKKEAESNSSSDSLTPQKSSSVSGSASTSDGQSSEKEVSRPSTPPPRITRREQREQRKAGQTEAERTIGDGYKGSFPKKEDAANYLKAHSSPVKSPKKRGKN